MVACKWGACTVLLLPPKSPNLPPFKVWFYCVFIFMAHHKQFLCAEYCTKVLDYDVRYLLYVEEDKELYIAEYDGNITSISVEVCINWALSFSVTIPYNASFNYLQNGNVVKKLIKKCDCVWGLAAVRDEIWAACSDGDIVAYQRSVHPFPFSFSCIITQSYTIIHIHTLYSSNINIV